MDYLKKFIGIKYLKRKQCPVRLSPIVTPSPPVSHLLAKDSKLNLRWLLGLKLIQLEQQKPQLPFIILAKNLKPILCRTIKDT